MTEQLFNELDDKLIELTEILVKLSNEIREDDNKYFELVRKHAGLEVPCEKLEKEAKQNEYDKEYFENLLKENDKNQEKKF